MVSSYVLGFSLFKQATRTSYLSFDKSIRIHGRQEEDVGGVQESIDTLIDGIFLD